MNKLEKDILDSEMGLYSRRVEETAEEETQETEIPEELPEIALTLPEEYTEDGVQLNFSDMLGDGEGMALDDHVELDMSSLSDPDEETDDAQSEPEKEYDG